MLKCSLNARLKLERLLKPDIAAISINIVLVNVVGNTHQRAVLLALALNVDDPHVIVGKQLVESFIHLAVNQQLEEIRLIFFSTRCGVDAVQKNRMSGIACGDVGKAGAVAVDQRTDNRLRKIVLRDSGGIREIDGDNINFRVIRAGQPILGVGRYEVNITRLQMMSAVAILKGGVAGTNVPEQSFCMRNTFVIKELKII